MDPDARRARAGTGATRRARGRDAELVEARAAGRGADGRRPMTWSSTSPPRTPTAASRRRWARWPRWRARTAASSCSARASGRRRRREAFLDALGGATADELPLGLDALLDAALAAGLRPIAPPRVATAADWAAYEEGLAAEAERYDDAEAQRYAARIRARRALPDGRTTLGFALVILRR